MMNYSHIAFCPDLAEIRECGVFAPFCSSEKPGSIVKKGKQHMKKDTTKPALTPAPATPQPDLATLLAAVFAHPDLPEKMWEHIADGLCEMDHSFDKYHNPEVVREVLAGYRTLRQTKQ